jgi:hypothetical protein
MTRAQVESLIAYAAQECPLVANEHHILAMNAARIEGYLSGALTASKLLRDDNRAIESLATAAKLAASLLAVPTIALGDKAHEGHLATLQSTLKSLAATLLGETLPDPQITRKAG